MGYDDMDMETIIMNLIVDAGSARSYSMEAIALAKEGKFQEAYAAIDSADEEILKAHRLQTGLIQEEAAGNKTEINLMIIHAQDHIMTSMLAKDMAKEFVMLYEKVAK